MDYSHAMKRYFGGVAATIALKHVDFLIECLEIVLLFSNLLLMRMRASFLTPPNQSPQTAETVSNILLIFMTDWLKILF